MKDKKKELRADVVIIGAGITGILSAYLLTKAGKKVIVVEKGEVGEGATKLTTAFITQLIDTSLTDLIKLFGLHKAKLIIESHGSAIDLLEQVAKDENIKCNFIRCSNFFYANSEKDISSLKEEYTAGKKLGLEMKLHTASNELYFENAGYIEIKNQAKFDVYKAIDRLAARIRKNGGTILEQTKATSVKSDDSKAIVETTRGTIHADYAIVSTYGPFNHPLALFFKKAYYTTYVMRIGLPKNTLREGIYEDMEDPYHYFRVDKEKRRDVVVIGGEDHRSDIPVKAPKNYAALEEYINSIFPRITYKKLEKWKGPIIEPVDGLPFIGPFHSKNVLYATAFSGNGMTYSAIAAMIFRDYILGKKNDWLKVYNAERVPSPRSLLVKGRDYTNELIHGALKNSLRKKS
jgi:glycine/D-amino acid oxidase-like deaminating enzyme